MFKILRPTRVYFGQLYFASLRETDTEFFLPRGLTNKINHPSVRLIRLLKPFQINGFESAEIFVLESDSRAVLQMGSTLYNAEFICC
jgi:hypothetical protein